MADQTSVQVTPALLPPNPKEKSKNPFVRLFSILGPGLITGASDDDPSGIGTYAVTGAQFGFSCLWLCLFSFPLMTAVQYICAKIGLVRGRGIASVLRKNCPLWVCYTVVVALLIANTINAGADIGAIGAGLNLMVPAIPIQVTDVVSTVIILATMAFGTFRTIERIFRWLTLSLFAYVITAFCVHANWALALRDTFIPNVRWSSDYIAVVVAFLGTTISPYMFFWQPDQEVANARAAEPEQARHRNRDSFWRACSSRTALADAGLDTAVGMFFSNFVSYFIVFTTASTLFVHHQTHVGTAAEAALALRPFAGNFAFALFALGLIGTGMLGVPVLIGSAAYAISQAFAWKFGFQHQPTGAKRFYVVVVLSGMVALLLNFAGINAMSALFWTAVINGFLAPPLLFLIMMVATNHKIMGPKVLAFPIAVLGWLTTALMAVAAVLLVWTSLHH